jgi:hypothetical protein
MMGIIEPLTFFHCTELRMHFEVFAAAIMSVRLCASARKKRAISALLHD